MWVRCKQLWTCCVELGIPFLTMYYMIVHWKTQPRNNMTIVSGTRMRHPWTPGSRWIISDKILGQDTPPSMSSPSSKPHSVGISQFFPVENYSLPMSPAIYQWLDVKTDILQAKGSLGKSQRALAYAKGQYLTISDKIRQYPRLPTLSAGRLPTGRCWHTLLLP